MEDLPTKTTLRSAGNRLYNQWFNEQSNRAFSVEDKLISFDDCFNRVHKFITSGSQYKTWVAKHQQGRLNYVAGGGGAVALPVTDINVNFIKSAMGLPYYRFGAISSWSSSDSIYAKQIGAFSALSSVDRYLTIREMMIQTLSVSFAGLPFKNELINAFITVYHSETDMQVAIHNCYYSFGDNFGGKGLSSSIGKPDSNAFGLGQWLGSRLIDLFYFTASCVTELADPRSVDPSILYHPSIHMGFLAFEMRKGSVYYKKLSAAVEKWKKAGVQPSYFQFVSLILIEVQIIPVADTKQFKASEKIASERRTVAKIPKDYKFTNILTRLA